MSAERFLLDTSALMALIEDEAGADRVGQIISQGHAVLPWPALLKVYGICESHSQVSCIGGAMLRVAGIYDGKSILLHEPLPIPLHTTVEILVAEETINPENLYWQRLVELGLVKSACLQPARESTFAPIQVVGEPVSQTIIEERR